MMPMAKWRVDGAASLRIETVAISHGQLIANAGGG